MHKTEDKGKVKTHDQSDLLGIKPFGNIGPGRSADEMNAVVSKLKKKKVDSLRAEGSTSESGEEANMGNVSKAIKGFVNR